MDGRELDGETTRQSPTLNFSKEIENFPENITVTNITTDDITTIKTNLGRKGKHREPKSIGRELNELIGNDLTASQLYESIEDNLIE